MLPRWFPALLSIFGCLVCSQAYADPVPLLSDSFIQRGAATTNNGNSTSLTVKDSGDSSTTRKVYLQFDVSAVPGAVASAELALTIANIDAGGSTLAPMTLQLFGLNDGFNESWTETGITWNNAPANNTADNGMTSDAQLLAQLTVATDRVNGDVLTFTNADSTSTDALLDFLNADSDGLVTFVLRRVAGNSSNNLSLASDEHLTLAAPSLNVTAVPEPTTWAYGLALTTGLFFVRRRFRN